MSEKENKVVVLVIDPSLFKVMEFDKDAYFEELQKRKELALITSEERLLDLPN